MKEKYKILGSMLLIGVIAVSLGVALADANVYFGKSLTTAEMAIVFGGKYVCTGDTDCDTVSVTTCPGGDTCDNSSPVAQCYNCLSGAGDVCGTPSSWPGVLCVNGTESCNGSIGSCNNGLCEMNTGGGTPGSGCGTRPNCD